MLLSRCGHVRSASTQVVTAVAGFVPLQRFCLDRVVGETSAEVSRQEKVGGTLRRAEQSQVGNFHCSHGRFWPLRLADMLAEALHQAAMAAMAHCHIGIP